jgi:hypothetical protein
MVNLTQKENWIHQHQNEKAQKTLSSQGRLTLTDSRILVETRASPTLILLNRVLNVDSQIFTINFPRPTKYLTQTGITSPLGNIFTTIRTN